jgi:hypothetical protein
VLDKIKIEKKLLVHLRPQLEGQHLNPLEQFKSELQAFLGFLQSPRAFCKIESCDSADGHWPKTTNRSFFLYYFLLIITGLMQIYFLMLVEVWLQVDQTGAICIVDCIQYCT